MSQPAAVALKWIVAGLVLATPLATVDLLLEGHALTDGRIAVLLDSRLYLPDAQGRLYRAPDGSYARRDGGAIVVASGRATPPASAASTGRRRASRSPRRSSAARRSR